MAENDRNPEQDMPAGAMIERVNAPFFYASTIQVAVASNDVSMIFARPHPVVMRNAHEEIHGATSEAVAIVAMSIQNIKDLSILLGDLVGKYEDEFGVIQTEYTQARTAKK
ncbi:hypothetical protein JYU29_05030 [Tianweitania sp. BSSL-BM11]|uniref:DUF3467 domain-containing protein n=1 Tax=Tianweitania aestuarii TaxID=2814886 RepID=A0ABS5RSL9_9HYPH|nr:hypothetical protein [Tianweitania aestuarii]MBS9720051.1 hypothetical protein [Tianweitania aestuarii]